MCKTADWVLFWKWENGRPSLFQICVHLSIDWGCAVKTRREKMDSVRSCFSAPFLQNFVSMKSRIKENCGPVERIRKGKGNSPLNSRWLALAFFFFFPRWSKVSGEAHLTVRVRPVIAPPHSSFSFSTFFILFLASMCWLTLVCERASFQPNPLSWWLFQSIKKT